MRIALGWFLLAGLATALRAQPAKLPADVHPDSLSRFPVVNRADLSEEGQRIYDYVGGKDRKTPLLGPGGISMHSPGSAEPIQRLNQYLRNESVIKGKFFELCSLIAAREFDQQFEWSGHEPAALRSGLDQAVIDVIKYNRPVEGLPEKETVVIQMGRQLLREHKLGPELFAKSVELFGRQGTLELVTTIGDYVMAAIMLSAADQRLPADRPLLLPVR